MSAGNNMGVRKHPTTTKNAIKAFDRLPAEARHALANAAGNWVPQPLLTQYRRDELPGVAAIVARIELWNQIELIEREHERARAPGPYRGNAPAPNMPRRQRGRQ